MTKTITAPDGTDIPADQVAAVYSIPADVWTDLREARPRCRAMAPDPGDGGAVVNVTVVVTKDGALHYDDKAKLKIDRYPGAEYAAVRAESEAWWARYDADKAAGR